MRRSSLLAQLDHGIHGQRTPCRNPRRHQAQKRHGKNTPANTSGSRGVASYTMNASTRLLRWLHIVSLVWGILTELLLWPCPLNLLENWLETKAGVEPYQGGFLLHYLDKLVYPDISPTVLTIAGVLVCALNLAFYGRQAWVARSR